jgi:opacity protein-like surface antigen
MHHCFQNSTLTRFCFYTAVLALVLCAQVTLAQPPPPDDPNNVGGGSGGSGGGAGVPIDGGLSILLAAGAGLGLKKAWDARKNNHESDNEDDSASDTKSKD